MSPRKVLLADDEEDIKIVVKMYLESRGYQVVTAYDGLDALSIAINEKPDIILLDVMMPVIDGFEVARRLKANDKTKQIPIVMVSAASQAANVERGLEAGAVEYLTKPFEPARLEEIIVSLLK